MTNSLSQNAVALISLIIDHWMLKEDKEKGNWNIYTRIRAETPDHVILETIYSKRTAQKPVPAATASVWFEVESNYKVTYRVEHNHMIYTLQLNKDLVESKDIKDILTNNLPNPLVRLLEVLHFKSIHKKV